MAPRRFADMLDLAAHGARVLETPARKNIARFVLEQQRSSGGFAGRDGGEADLYYTVFAAGVLGALGHARPLLRIARYARGLDRDAIGDFVHLACLARLNARLPRVGPRARNTDPGELEAFRTLNGGYHHAIRGASHGTAYAAFLATLVYGDWRRPLPDAGRLTESLDVLRAEDGGYANEPNAPEGNTNATAAALVVQLRHGAQPDPGALDWLLARRHPAGGFHAAPAAPIPDLLSTASALHALRAHNMPLDALRAGTLEFVELCWNENGGFRGHLLDDRADCEYTFYALLALGCLT